MPGRPEGVRRQDNLKRELEERGAAAETPPTPAAEDPLEDLHRKQRRLAEGIRRLQETVEALTQELEDAREENRQLREQLRARTGPSQAGPQVRPQSLISQAME